MDNSFISQFEAFQASLIRNTLSHQEFCDIWNWAFSDPNSTLICDETVPVTYNSGKEVFVLSDLYEVLHNMDQQAVHIDDKRKLLNSNKDVLNRFLQNRAARISLDVKDSIEDGVWYNSTEKGINLRPGLRTDSGELPPALTLEGQKSHAIVGGRTGSGKSVFLNNLILNLMKEYPPWEIELFLADFKKVEMSRYMTVYPSPHVSACAATSEIEYVLSLIRYIKHRKDERELFFSKIGIQKIEDFRKEYPDVVMPRILFLVDEFQQLFLDSNSRQRDLIDSLITDITRKGRSAGVHLLFASQDMSGALSEKQLSNFKVRFALACDSTISNEILGNNRASSLHTGQVILNYRSKNEADNIVFDVPFADDDALDDTQSYFYNYLQKQMDMAVCIRYDYLEKQKFYDENKQFSIDKLRSFLDPSYYKSFYYGTETWNNSELLNISHLQEIRREQLNSNNKQFAHIFVSFVLGRMTVHTNKKYDIDSLFVEYGKNKSLLAVSSSNEDLAYIQKLLAINYQSLSASTNSSSASDFGSDWSIQHYYYDFNPVVSTLYGLEERQKDLDLTSDNIFSRTEDLEEAYDIFSTRMKLLDNISQSLNAVDFLLLIIRTELEDALHDLPKSDYEREIDNQMKAYQDYYSSLPRDDNAFFSMLIKNQCPITFVDELIFCLKCYYRSRILNIPSNMVLPPTVFWFSGIEMIDRIPRWLESFSSNSLSANIFCMFFSTTSVDSDIFSSSNYIFVGGHDQRLFEKYYGESVHKADDSITLFCSVRSNNRHFSFKKYSYKFVSDYETSFDFDKLFSLF